MRILYFGSGEFGLPTLKALNENHQVVAVITQPSRPAGRRRRPTPTPIAAWAKDAGLPVIETAAVNTPEFIQQVKDLAPEAGVVIAFGQKLSPPLIESLGQLSFNLHASLLPRHRGATPINQAILSGDTQTGLSIISLAQRMDAGLIYAQASTPIDPAETAGELHDRLAAIGPSLVRGVLTSYAQGTLKGKAQDESLATPAHKLTKADGHVDFTQPADQVRRRVHGLTPWPGVSVQVHRAGQEHSGETLILKRVAIDDDAHTQLTPGTMLDNHRVATANGVVHLIEVQPPGRRPMTIQDYTRGHRLDQGDRLVPIHPS